MLDIRYIRENAEKVAEQAKQKGYDIDVSKLLQLDEQRRELLTETEQIRAERNALADKSAARPPDSSQIELGKKLKDKLSELDSQLQPLERQYTAALKEVPNVFSDDTPLGGEDANQEIRKWGETGDKDFAVKNHLTWAEERGLLDFERGAKVAGAKFYYVKGSLVELEFALLQLGMRLATEHG